MRTMTYVSYQLRDPHAYIVAVWVGLLAECDRRVDAVVLKVVGLMSRIRGSGLRRVRD
jgi:hypothetical protein